MAKPNSLVTMLGCSCVVLLCVCVDSPATSELKAPHNAAETAEAVQSPEAGPQLPEHLFKICVGHPGTYLVEIQFFSIF